MTYLGCSTGSAAFTCSRCGFTDTFAKRFGVPYRWGCAYINDRLEIYCPKCVKELEGKHGEEV